MTIHTSPATTNRSAQHAATAGAPPAADPGVAVVGPAPTVDADVVVPVPSHLVENQPPFRGDHNLWADDLALQEAVSREGGGWDAPTLHDIGATLGSEAFFAHGDNANRYLPELKAFDRLGHRRNVVQYHPSYHACMAASKAWKIHGLPWTDPQPGAMVARLARMFLMSQVEQGHICPITMTFAAVPALRVQPDVAAAWLPGVLAPVYDPADLPAARKEGLTIGMAMTEKQGGSDVRSNTTRALPAEARRGPGAAYRLVGHKWFCSAPMSDAFLTLAWVDGGLTCFLLPRWAPDGDRLQVETVGDAQAPMQRNPMWLQRLKDKTGNRSNASGEVEYHGALAWMVGEPGRGVRTILEMVAHTRMDCVVGSAATIRQVVAQAAWHCQGRAAFGAKLTDKPLMRNVIADMQLESEAATALALRLGRAYDESLAGGDGAAAARALLRIATAIGKYHVCKIAPTVAYEAMECFGGSGFTEDSPVGRHFRDAPVNSIWEGSGNVICLDVLRVLAREPDAVEALRGELASARGLDRRYDQWLAATLAALADASELEGRARAVVERLALALQAATLLRAAAAGSGSSVIAEAFCAARLGERGALRHFGTLAPGPAIDTLVARARPALG